MKTEFLTTKNALFILKQKEKIIMTSLTKTLPTFGSRTFKTALALVAGFVFTLSGTSANAEKMMKDKAMSAPTHAVLGEKAPDFTLTDVNGTSHNLSDFAGKIVVLEWTNHQCPYVVKHYKSGNMQSKQKAAAEQDVVWLSINSSADGKQGHLDTEEGQKVFAEKGFMSAALLLDPTGKVGKKYRAVTTPQAFVVDANGTLVYAGAVDDRPSTSVKSIEGATSHVQAAIADLTAGNAVQVASTKPYGCSVKY